MKRLISALLVIVMLLSFVACAKKGTDDINDNNNNEDAPPVEFSTFSNGVLLDSIGDDLFLWNSLVDDPSNWGYVRDESYTAYYYAYEDYKTCQSESYEYACKVLRTLEKYDYDSLTQIEQEKYDAIEYTYSLEKIASDPNCTWYLLVMPTYISQYGGYVAELADKIENMKLKSEQDIIDIIDYLKSTSYVFLTYLTYCQDRIDAGLPLSDYVIDQMVDYLDGIIDAGDSYYLIDYIQGKIDAVDFLNNEEKESYKEKYESAVSSSFMTACTVLRYRLTNYRGQWTGKNETEIIHYGNVCDGYYQYKLCSVLGITSMDLDSYGDELYSWYSSVYEYYTDIVNRASELSEEDQERLVSIIGNKDSFLDYSSAEDLIELLLESSSSLVYELEYKPNISIKYTDETVQEYVSYIAYYLLSPYDEKFSENESITLNESQTGSFLNLCFTLAHEGYPGHLYAHVLAKQNDLSALVELYSTLGSSEGWAQYAAYTVLLSYAATQEDEIISLAIEYVCVSTFLDYISSSFFDYLVNYRGYTSTYLQNNYGFSKTEAEETIEFYSGDPCTIASYGYGLAMQLQFHSSVKSTLGEDYSEQEYNQYLLTHYANFGLIKLNEATEKYILEKANQQ